MAGNLDLGAGLAGSVAVASGVSLLIGFLTPFAGGVVGIGTLALALSWLPIHAPALFDTKPTAILAITVAVAIVFLGPGAYSLDCRLFGRRQIIIPPVPRSPRS